MQEIEGLFISAKNYSETSVIVQLYTKQYSRQSFIFNGVKGKNKPYIFQAFHFINFSCRFNQNKQLNTAYVAELICPFHSITTDIRKASIALFLTEVLSKVLVEGNYSDKLYDFLLKTITEFNNQKFNPNFHLFFIVKLLTYLGIQPENNYCELSPYFNMNDACFSNKSSSINNYNINNSLSKFLGTNIDVLPLIILDKKDRNEMLYLLLKYIKKHLQVNTGNIKSHHILKTIFN